MIEHSDIPLNILLPFSFFGGYLIGYVYFHSLRKTADLIVKQSNPLFAITLTLTRLVLISGGLYFAAINGGTALLTALAGVLCAKAQILRQPNGAAS